MPLGTQAEPLGYVIEGDGRTVYFAGDTDLFDEMADLAPVDVALLPIWGWGPTMGPGTWTRRARRRRPRSSEPRSRSRSTGARTTRSTSGCKGRPAFLKTPPALFEQAISEHAPETTVRVLAPGEQTAI